MTAVTSPERRMVTILFCDLSDSTGLSAELEPEQFAELLEQIRRIADQIIPAHSGEVIRWDGDGMICLFGVPDALEDAGRRATEAAIDMAAALDTLDLGFAWAGRRLQLHSGVHAGMVLLRRGDIVRGKYEILGDATNCAARICDAARPGEILVSTQSLGSDRHLFITAGERLVAVRGQAGPLACLPVLGRTAVRRRFDAQAIAGLTRFQGREAQTRQFSDWLGQADRAPPLLYLHGPAGIGKSRLLQQLVQQAHAAGWRVAQGYCEAYLGARPLQPFHQMVATLQPEQAGSPPDAAGLATALAGQDRMLLVIDDWQWADDASRDLLAQLLDGAGAGHFRCMLASRVAAANLPGELNSLEMELPPLDRNAALGVIEALLRSPDPFDVSRIEQAAGGSPLLIEELCHAIAAGLHPQAQHARGGWFDLAVQARFDRLLPHDARLLKRAAVIGHMVPVWLLETLHGQALDDRQLARLQAADFLFTGDAAGTCRFKHGLTRDSLYAGIGLAERRALHADVLAALEAAVADHPPGALLDGLAYHALAAGNIVRGLPYAIAAGDAALAAGALDRAQAHYLAALGIVPSLPAGKPQRDASWTLINKFGLACIIDPAPDQLPVLERAQAILIQHGSRRDAMRAAYWLGSIAYGVGMGKRSVRHLEQALTLAQAGGSADDALLIRTKLAQSRFKSGQMEAAAALHGELLPQHLAPGNRNRRELSAYAHANFGFLQSECGNYAEAQRLFAFAETILADGSSAANASILLYRAAALVSQGLWDAAMDAANAVLAISGRTRTRMQNRNGRAQRAFALWQSTGDILAADQLDDIAAEYCATGNSRQDGSMVFGWAVEAMVELGRRDRAQFFMGQIIARAREGGDRLGEAMAWRAMARLAQAEDDAARADRRLAAARRSEARRPSRREAAHNSVCQARLWLARGETDSAAALLLRAAQEFEAMAMPWYRDQAISLVPITQRVPASH